ncbi:MAG: hypothetical protein AAGK23_14450 [Pseudomonadota bacterium]
MKHTAIGVLVVCLLAGCASHPETTQFERELKRATERDPCDRSSRFIDCFYEVNNVVLPLPSSRGEGTFRGVIREQRRRD